MKIGEERTFESRCRAATAIVSRSSSRDAVTARDRFAYLRDVLNRLPKMSHRDDCVIPHRVD
jgi:hypothetical protein